MVKLKNIDGLVIVTSQRPSKENKIPWRMTLHYMWSIGVSSQQSNIKQQKEEDLGGKLENGRRKYLKQCHLENYFKKMKCTNDYIKMAICLKLKLCGNFSLC